MKIVTLALCLLMISVNVLPVNASGPRTVDQLPNSAIAAPCYIELPKIYLVIEKTRRHILDWDTFLNLGYKQADIVPCGEAASYPEGTSIWRLIKGSTPEVYLMENGRRRHIPDMDTFRALGYSVSEITTLPDSVVVGWPLGEAIPANTEVPHLEQTVNVGYYVIRLWKPVTGLGKYATISFANHGDIIIDGAETILVTPNVTGPDHLAVTFLTRAGFGSHCCSGTVTYDLSAMPTKVLDIMSTVGYNDTGRGEFKDIDGDGISEFITFDALTQLPCTAPSAQVILRYDPKLQRYVGDSPHFAAYYTPLLAQLTAQASQSSADKCDVAKLVITRLNIGQEAEAKSDFTQFYTGDDGDAFWNQIVAAAHTGSHFAGIN